MPKMKIFLQSPQGVGSHEFLEDEINGFIKDKKLFSTNAVKLADDCVLVYIFYEQQSE